MRSFYFPDEIRPKRRFKYPIDNFKVGDKYGIFHYNYEYVTFIGAGGFMTSDFSVRPPHKIYKRDGTFIESGFDPEFLKRAVEKE